MKTSLILFQMIILFSGISFAEVLSFHQVWSKIIAKSPAQKAIELQVESLAQSKERSDRHWLPRVYLDAKAFQTNDPGTVFFGLLSQRAVQTNDFSPQSLNQPESKGFVRGALGIDLPLYEGGSKSSQVKIANYSLRASQDVAEQLRLDQYTQVGERYGSLLILKEQKTYLSHVQLQLENLIKSYRLGQKDNPVGYSGLLGMKSLLNRIAGLISQNMAQTNSIILSLKEMGLENSNWEPSVEKPNVFIERYLSLKTDDKVSFQLSALEQNVKSLDEAINIEKSKLIPRVGAFAETYAFNGNRDTANGYFAGLYLQWSLFDPNEFGSVKEAKLKSLSMQKNLEALEIKEKTEKIAGAESIQAIQTQLRLIDDSIGLLQEQSKVAETLFRNGSLTALQIVEIQNRRVDLILQMSEAHTALLKTSTQMMMRNSQTVASTLKSGEQNEK